MEQEFPSFLMESYVQEKLLICTWKHTGFAFCFSTNTVLAYIRKISGNKWVIPRVYYKSCGASTSQSDSYSHKRSITWIFVQICPYSSHLQVFQTGPDPAPRGSLWHSHSSPAGFWEERCPARCHSLAHPRISLPGAGRRGNGIWGDGQGLVLDRETLGSLVLNLPRFNDRGMKRFHKKVSVTELVWIKTSSDKLQ